jgi:hypothetical protein
VVRHKRQQGVTDANEASDEAVSRGVDEHALPSDIGLTPVPDVERVERNNGRRETVMINAAICGPRGGLPAQFKPIVVDLDLAVW